MTTPTVVVVGSINRDLLIETPTLPRPGETVIGTALRGGVGGKGANQAVAAARAGACVRLIGAVGADGAELLDALQAAGVKVADVRAFAAVRSGAAAVTVSADGENSIVVIPGANALIDAELVSARFEKLVETTAVLVLQGEVPAATIDHAARLAAARGWRIVLNLAPYLPLKTATIAVADPLIVNEHEAAALLSAKHLTAREPEDAAVALATLARSVVITLGADGAVLCSPSGAERILAAPTTGVVDTTGAGDAFVGVFAAALAAGNTLVDAARHAAVAGARAVAHRGAQPGQETSA
ncbi:MAG TPA: ribokinase [Lacisediminihabitans sp.]|uniref:ribokinase n=1 Tax=Lacisediminihabitans sp. TaxID=2787631 RepID=UPI002ED99EB8